MLPQNKTVKGFLIASKSYYWDIVKSHNPDDMIDEIIVGIYNIVEYEKEQKSIIGCSGEFNIRFEKLCHDVVQRIIVYSDAYHVIGNMPELFNNSRIIRKFETTDEYAEYLKSLGYIDLTQYTSDITKY